MKQEETKNFVKTRKEMRNNTSSTRNHYYSNVDSIRCYNAIINKSRLTKICN